MQMIATNANRYGDSSNSQFSKQLMNSNTTDNLAKRIEFNNN